MSGEHVPTVPPALPPLPTALPELIVGAGQADSVVACAVAVRGAPSESTGDGAELQAPAVVLGLAVDALRAAGAGAEPGRVRSLPLLTHGTGWVLGLGDGTADRVRQAGSALARALAEAGDNGNDVALDLPDQSGADEVRALALGLLLGGYRYNVTGEGRDREHTVPRRIRIRPASGHDVQALRDAVAYATRLAEATALARDLANTPSNVKDPAWLAETAAALAGSLPGLTAIVRDEEWLAEQRFGGTLAVGGGSTRPPRLLELHWDGRAPRADCRDDDDSDRANGSDGHLALVGKGITFDTGGISLKPAEGMHLMRTDMAGGAAVIGAMTAIARLRLPLRVTALIPCAENHMSGSAYRPGDIVRHHGGATTEVVNTDAEGRMVMADALAYAVGGYGEGASARPDAIVDVATLTGAMKVALGLRTGGLFATDDELAQRVSAAGAVVGEDWWRLPLSDDHAEDVYSEIADLRQAPPGPGGLAAALFLREFTRPGPHGGEAGQPMPWAHLDIAGPARAEQPYAEATPVATGFAARSLVELAASRAR